MGRRGAKKEEATAAPADAPAAATAGSPAAAASKTKAASPATASKAAKAATSPVAKAQHDKKEVEEVEEVLEENEVVLAKDSGQLYEAKVMRVDEGKGNAPRKYFIHYQGWKSKWDKWVGSDELLKKNETTLKLQAQLKQAAKKRPTGGGAKAQGADGEGGEATGGAKKDEKRGKKGGAGAMVPVDPDVEPVVEGSNDPQVKLAMPFTLKKQLVDDWEMVTRYVCWVVGWWVVIWFLPLCSVPPLLLLSLTHSPKPQTTTPTASRTSSCPCPARPRPPP